MRRSNVRSLVLSGLHACAISIVLMFPPVVADIQGRPVYQVLDEFRKDGLALVYSTNLVTQDLRVTTDPVSSDPVAQVDEILQPHGLVLTRKSGVYLVVRVESAPDLSEVTVRGSPVDTDFESMSLELEAISVSASRYILFSNSRFFIDQRAIQALPDLGEDPIRSAQRLPGVAASGLSSRSHFRGGEHNETAIYLNGMKLLDPFHIRDYHSIFSSIDARAISGVEAYTGGFPVNFGDQMSGVLVLETQRAEAPLHTELGVSVYNTSLLNSGFTSGDKIDWLISARDSNLDVILNEDLGKPDYFDVFAEIGVNFTEDFRLSFNALYSKDKVTVITESDPEELERSISNTQNRNFWVTLNNQWTPDLSSTTVFSYSGLDNKREAEANDPERLQAFVIDVRDAEILGFRQDWLYQGLDSHDLRAGIELKHERARYRYHSRAEYRGFFEFYPGIENPARSNIVAAPKGNSFSLFLSDRWHLNDNTGLELGIRWDRQTYTELDFGNQFSPRISLLHSLGPATDFRMSWGRYYQSQAIQELQVEDGLDHFFAPQRANHWIAGLQHRFRGGFRLRVEAFLKNYDRLNPRFENLFDPLVLIPELAPDRVRLDPSSALARGVELTLEYRGSEELNWWVSYSLAKVTDRINGVDQRRSWDQRHALQTGLAWTRGPWEVGVALNFHTGWPTTGLSYTTLLPEDENDEPVFIPVPGPRNAEQLGMFAQLDFRVSREYPVRIGRLSAFFEVTNLTNRKNECCIDYDIDEMEDGTLFLDRTVDHWLPIIPAIGIFWEF